MQKGELKITREEAPPPPASNVRVACIQYGDDVLELYVETDSGSKNLFVNTTSTRGCGYTSIVVVIPEKTWAEVAEAIGEMFANAK